MLDKLKCGLSPLKTLLIVMAYSWLVMMLSSSPPVYAQDVKTYIPANAYKLLPTVKEEVYRVTPPPVFPEYYPALIEHESCVSLKHSRCWSSTSQLKSARETGAGLGQITVAYNKDGSVRFDALNEIRNKHMKDLNELSWSNVYQRPELQIRSMVLMTGDNLKSLWQVKNPLYRYHMADAAYNGGIGHLSKERLQCGLTKGCDPQQWFGHVAEIKTIKSLKPLYGTRSPWEINRHHTYDVFNNRMPKYVPLMKP